MNAEIGTRTFQHAKLRQVMAQAKARQIVDKQYFEQRAQENMAARFDSEECEANAPRFFPHQFDHMNGTVK